MEIKCCTCRRWLDENNFAVDTTHITGRGRSCRVCHSAYAREHYRKNRDKVLKRVKERYTSDPSVHLEYLKKWRKTRSGKDSHYRDTLEQRRKFPEKHAAHLAVQRALYSGKLIKEACSICGTNDSIHAHHEDYAKPLEVIWLCRRHHQDKHKELKSQADLKTVGI